MAIFFNQDVRKGVGFKLQIAPTTGDEVNREDHDLVRTGL
jgi:hypothetical protein